jgi:hypothetical protein
MKWFGVGLAGFLFLLAVAVILGIYNDYKDIKAWRDSE